MQITGHIRRLEYLHPVVVSVYIQAMLHVCIVGFGGKLIHAHIAFNTQLHITSLDSLGRVVWVCARKV